VTTAPECRVTGGDHVWQEGGARDWGRYSCSRCMQCLYVPGLIAEMRKYRQQRDALAVALTPFVVDAEARTSRDAAIPDVVCSVAKDQVKSARAALDPVIAEIGETVPS